MSNGPSESPGSLEAFGNRVVSTLRSLFRDKLIIRLLDSEDNPRPGGAYELKVGGRVFKDKLEIPLSWDARMLFKRNSPVPEGVAPDCGEQTALHKPPAKRYMWH